MSTTPSGWRILDGDRAFLVRTYSIGPGNTSNCLIVRSGAGELLVLSPSARPDDASLAELEEFGRVRAIVAPNGYHRAGIPDWCAAFPEAAVYTPASALPRVRKVASEAQDVAELAAALPDGVRLLTLPSMRSGETWLTVQTGTGLTWCVGDTLTNLDAHPFGLGWMFRAFGVGVGFGLNRAQRRFMALDRAAHTEFLRERLAEAPPTQIVPAHGALVGPEALEPRLRALFDRL